MKRVSEPYRSEVVGGKGSVFYRAHSYHTKVPPEGIVRMIEHYTNPGDVVVDPFCGSGMTGVACSVRTDRGAIRPLPRRRPHRFRVRRSRQHPEFPAAARALLDGLATLERESYGTRCAHCAAHARIEYTVWSDSLDCPSCAHRIRFWDAAKQPDGTLSKTLRCPQCAARSASGRPRSGPVPVLVSVSCSHCRRRDQRPPTKRELTAALRTPAPTSRTGIRPRRSRTGGRCGAVNTGASESTLPQTSSPIATCARSPRCGAAANESPAARHAALRRDGSRQPGLPALPVESRSGPTNVLSGTLYVASLTYEFNVFSLLRRKLTAVTNSSPRSADAPGALHGAASRRPPRFTTSTRAPWTTCSPIRRSAPTSTTPTRRSSGSPGSTTSPPPQTRRSCRRPCPPSTAPKPCKTTKS